MSKENEFADKFFIVVIYITGKLFSVFGNLYY